MSDRYFKKRTTLYLETSIILSDTVGGIRTSEVKWSECGGNGDRLVYSGETTTVEMSENLPKRTEKKARFVEGEALADETDV